MQRIKEHWLGNAYREQASRWLWQKASMASFFVAVENDIQKTNYVSG